MAAAFRCDKRSKCHERRDRQEGEIRITAVIMCVRIHMYICKFRFGGVSGMMPWRKRSSKQLPQDIKQLA